MRGTPHALIGAGCGLLLWQGHDPTWLIAAGALGALVPDLDHEHALLSTVPVLGWVASGVVRLGVHVLNVVRPVRNPFPQVFPDKVLVHRGPFHSLVLGALLTFGLYAAGLPTLVVAAFGLGFLSHLFSDMLSFMGVPLFWPGSARLFHLTPRSLRFRSGSWLEWPLAVGMVIGALVLVTTRLDS